MLAKVYTSSIFGVDAYKSQVEVRIEDNEKERFIIIGLADNTVKEAKERVSSALKSYGFILPKKVIINLAPAEIPKEGSHFDLAIAISLLVAKGIIKKECLENISIFGELSLDGEVKSIRGTVALVVASKKNNIDTVIVPIANYMEAKLITGINVIPVRNLLDAIKYINDDEVISTNESNFSEQKDMTSTSDINEVWGQEQAKKALIVSATGGHNFLMIGSPGCGKSMLAKRIPAILPSLTEDEILDTVKIHSIANQSIKNIILGEAPFRSPHHNISEVGLLGGGSNPKPGEISLAHNGVLFLDEFPEFKRSALEALRAPLENGYINISRSKAKIFLPANFRLIAAMNPCPCGFLLSKSHSCRCSDGQILKYLNKLSGPIIDRIDLHVEMEEIDISKINTIENSYKISSNIKDVISDLKKMQIKRQGKLNNFLTGKELLSSSNISQEAIKFFEIIANKKKISARAYVKILKVSRTIADLNEEEKINENHIAKAIEFRKLDNLRNYLNKKIGNF